MLSLVLPNVGGKEGNHKLAQPVSSTKIKESRYFHVVWNTVSSCEYESLVSDKVKFIYESDFLIWHTIAVCLLTSLLVKSKMTMVSEQNKKATKQQNNSTPIPHQPSHRERVCLLSQHNRLR